MKKITAVRWKGDAEDEIVKQLKGSHTNLLADVLMEELNKPLFIAHHS